MNIQADLDSHPPEVRHVRKKKKVKKRANPSQVADPDFLSNHSFQPQPTRARSYSQALLKETEDLEPISLTQAHTSSRSSDDNSSEAGSVFSYGSDSSQGSDPGGSLLHRSAWATFCLHLLLLLQKTMWVFLRNKKMIVFQLFCPIFCCFGIVYYNSQGAAIKKNIVPVGAHHELTPVQPCFGDDCITISYFIVGNRSENYTWIDDIMRKVSVANDLKFEEEVKKIAVGTEPEGFLAFLEYNPNRTQYSVVWCTTEWVYGKGNFDSIPCQFSEGSDQEMIFYTLWYNKSLQESSTFRPLNKPEPKNPELVFLQESIDNAIMEHLYEKGAADDLEDLLDGPPQIKSSYSDFPVPLDRMFQNLDVMYLFGAYYFVLGPLITLLVMVQEIAKEKDLKLRQGLNVQGVSHFVYWMHWIIVGTVLNLLQIYILLFIGYFFEFDLWRYTPFNILFTLFFWFGEATLFLGLMISTFVRTREQASQIAYSIILANIIMEMVFSDSDFTFKLFFTDDARKLGYPAVALHIFNLLPSFSFSLAFGIIARKASMCFDHNSQNWKEAQPFTWDNFYEEQQIEFELENTVIHVPSVSSQIENFQWQLGLFFVIFWYLDHVISSNRGVGWSLYFPFQKSYWVKVFSFIPYFKSKDNAWKVKGKKKRVITEKDLGINVAIQDTLQSIEIEEQRVLEDEQKGIHTDGVRIVGIQKVYTHLPFGIKSPKDVHAVKGIHMTIQKNELLCLLGHNGAGKSTLFNMLTGIIGPTEGYARICGLDIRTQQDEIRKLIGIVPQFDILWDQLTAMEHMRLFSRIKGVPNKDIEKQSVQLLEQVNLEDVKDFHVSTYSGGMKRRLSVAISAIGNPKVIFFDEPTTGMDPVSRRSVWNLMQELKKSKTIILTTHAMEEADALADKIAVVVGGKLKCIGTPLNLKNSFGDGYKLSINCNLGDEEEVFALVKAIAPSANLLDNRGGSLMITIPLHRPQEIKPLFRLVEGSQGGGPYDSAIEDLKKIVLECGISQSSLEEVFIKVTRKKEVQS